MIYSRYQDRFAYFVSLQHWACGSAVEAAHIKQKAQRIKNAKKMVKPFATEEELNRAQDAAILGGTIGMS